MKKLKLLFLFVVLSSFSFHKKSDKDHAVSVKSGIDRIVQKLEENTHIGIQVVSLKSGQTLYQKNQMQVFVPCSTIKIFTAAAALHYLGPDFKFQTSFYTDGLIERGIVQGDLYLKGSGDPELSVEHLENMIFQLEAMQVREIRGNLVIDTSCFDGIEQGPGWMWDEGANVSNSPMDALTIQHSCVDLWVTPASQAGKRPHIRIYPKTSYVQIMNEAETSDRENDLDVERLWMQKENRIQVTGKIGLRSTPKKFKVTIEKPAFYAGTVCRELLKKNRILVKGEIVNGKTPEKAVLLASHYSSPLSILLHSVLKDSDNLYSNCIFKKCGEKVYGAPGSWQRGSQAVRNFLKSEAGLSIDDLVMLDGDGASRYNLVAPRHMAAFLKWVYEKFPFSPELIAALPLGGLEGSLKERDQDASVRATAGTLTGLSGLAGYATTADGEPVVFTIYQSGFTGKGTRQKVAVEDQICSLLSELTH